LQTNDERNIKSDAEEVKKRKKWHERHEKKRIEEHVRNGRNKIFRFTQK